MATPHAFSRRKLLLSALGLLSTSIAFEVGRPARRASATSSQSTSLGKLVYVTDGNLWSKALPDGQPVQLTTDGQAFAPSWSPSGEWLLFQKPLSRSFPQWWIMRADGSASRQINAFQAQWSPNSDRLAYQTADQRLVVEDPDGAHQALLSDASAVGQTLDGYWRWSPDGNWIAIASAARVGFPIAYVGIWAVRVDGTDSRELVARTNAQDGLLVAGWTPDSRWVLFSNDPSFSASHIADGLQWQAVALDPAVGAPRGVFAPTASDPLFDRSQTVLRYDDYLDLSPDETAMVTIRGGGRDAGTGKALSVVNTKGGFQSRDLTGSDVSAGSPTWSPDGKTIAYTEQPVGVPSSADPTGVLSRRVWLINPDGSDHRQLTHGDGLADRPQWSSDSASLLYVAPDTQTLVQGLSPSPVSASLVLFSLDDSSSVRVTDLTLPNPNDISRSYAYYGHFDWAKIFDWWQPC